jgi:hypothetical protein
METVREHVRQVRVADGGDRILATMVGLTIPLGLPFEKWEEAGPKLFRIADSSAWCIGDWLVYGQDTYQERYRHALASAGLEYQTLRNYAWVARAYEMPRRHGALSFQHHAELASLTPAEQDMWLDRAEKHGWSRNQLRRHVRESRGVSGGGETGRSMLPAIRTTGERLAQWRRAAGELGTELDAWIISTLDDAAANILATEAGR